jgi:hypothetical protein
MIKDIVEINFPKYATLSTATASIVDMGDKTITAQVKIDGYIIPDFSYDWEIEFRGERYIQPLREPQASKGNESISSIIDLTFYHKGIYDLKRYFAIELASTTSGTAIANNYVVSMNLNIGEFVDYLNEILKFYYGNNYAVRLYEDFQFDATDKKQVELNYTKIWDLVTQINEIFDVRWRWDTQVFGEEEKYTILIGFPPIEISHVFQYGFDGGLLKIERQVQNQDICNQMFGRGGSRNLPYRYFKKQDPNNVAWQSDPDWIPELENIYFSELRGKTFRDYVKGWKAKHYGGEPLAIPTPAYRKGYTDKIFSPVEYVEDTDSIKKYGVIQSGLENNEDIFPTIQNRILNKKEGRVDEIVAIEEIILDEPSNNQELSTNTLGISDSNIETSISSVNSPRTFEIVSNVYQVPYGYTGHFIKDFDISAIEDVGVTDRYSRFNSQGVAEVFETKNSSVRHSLDVSVIWIKVIDVNTSNEVPDIANIVEGTSFYIHAQIEVSNFYEGQKMDVPNYPMYGANSSLVRTPKETCNVVMTITTQLDSMKFNGNIVGNYAEGATRINKIMTVKGGHSNIVQLFTNNFSIPESGSSAIDVPIRIIPRSDDTGSYSHLTTIDVVDPDTNAIAKDENGEKINANNIPQGVYALRITVEINNFLDSAQSYKVELLPTYIYYPYTNNQWTPTFDIWVKDIWGSERLQFESDLSYANRIWNPILGDRQGNEAKIVFSSGLLSGHSDWEFPIVNVNFDDSKEFNGVMSHWRITLGKSDAEMKATSKWIPSIQTQGNAGDHFYFIGIDMPYQYVLWAESEVDRWKRENMLSQIEPTYVVALDKVRLNKKNATESSTLLEQLQIGCSIRTADIRFIKDYEVVYLQSITYTWDENTIICPNVDVVLSNSIKPSNDPFLKSNKKINNIVKRVNAKLVDIDELKIRTKSFVRESSATTSSLQAQISSSNDEINTIKASIGAGKDWLITTDKIKNGAITSEKIAPNAVLQQNLSLEVQSILRNARGVVGDDKYILTADPLDITKIQVYANVAEIDGGNNGLVDVGDLRDYLGTKLSIKILK